MVARPAKRRRRSTILSSGDEEDDIEKRPKRSHNLNSQGPSLAATKASVSPEKSVRKTSLSSKIAKPKPIYSFFYSGTEQDPGHHGDALDDLTDDSIDEEFLLLDGAGKPGTPVPGPHSEHVPTVHQKFLKSSDKVKLGAMNGDQVTSNQSGGYSRPWAERFAPVDLDELAVNKRKVSDVREWIYNALAGQGRKRLLVLKGPSGSGKTITVNLLSQVLKLDLLEWRNPTRSHFTNGESSSFSAQFEEFITRCGTFGRLDLSGPDYEDAESRRQNASSSKYHAENQAILIEEFPNTFARSFDALQAFRHTILRYLASKTPDFTIASSRSNTTPCTPMIMIISETLLTNTTAIADSFTAHRLLGPEILNHPGASVIEFNNIAPTFIKKALELVLQKEARLSGRKKNPGAAVLKKLGETGDIRSAVGSLEFICLKRGENEDWGKGTSNRKAIRGQVICDSTSLGGVPLEIVTQREASLGLFHAVGKVVYNKRDHALAPVPDAVPLAQPPEHLSEHVRLKRSQISVDNLIDETGTDTKTFIAALHENYLMSCDSLQTVEACIGDLSESDLLSLKWSGELGANGTGGGLGQGRSHGAGSDSLRQDEISFQTAVRGVLFGLPSPVLRWAPANPFRSAGSRRGTGGKGDAFKMFYPTSTRIWRQIQETESLVELLNLRMVQAKVSSIVKTINDHKAKEKVNGVESWERTSKAESSADTIQQQRSEDELQSPSIGGSSARREMILEKLPYMAIILRGSSQRSMLLSDIEEIIEFRNETMQDYSQPEDEDDIATTVQWATDQDKGPRKPSRAIGLHQHRTRQPIDWGEFGQRMPVETAVQKLILSDDDIEDY